MILHVAVTTADRAPRTNYVGATLRDLFRSSPMLDRRRLHLFVTAPETEWLDRNLAWSGLLPAREVCTLHVPKRRLTRNENGLALLRGVPRCDWLLHLEDDVSFCDDFIGSVVRWLKRHARPDRQLYSFCTFKGVAPAKREAWDQPAKSYGAIAVAMRWADSQSLAEWVRLHIGRWRLTMRQPWQVSGFDMMMREWASGPLLASNPSFAQHEGDESLTHAFRARPIMRSPYFAGRDWRYRDA
jgi:hypothetical protein